MHLSIYGKTAVPASHDAVVETNLTLSGRVDEMIATGFRAPETPFFCV